MDWLTPANRSKVTGKAISTAMKERPGTYIRLVSSKTRGAAAALSDRQCVVDFLKIAYSEAEGGEKFWFDTFKKRLSARFYHCCADIEYDNAEDLLKGITGFAAHMTGDHSSCITNLCTDERRKEIASALQRASHLNRHDDTGQLLRSIKGLVDEILERAGLMKKSPKKERLSPNYSPMNRTRVPSKKLSYLLNAGMSSMNESYHRVVNKYANKDLLFTVSMRARVYLSVLDWSERVEEVAVGLGMDVKARRENLKRVFKADGGGRDAYEAERKKIAKDVAKIIDKRTHQWRKRIKHIAVGTFEYSKEQAVKTLKRYGLVRPDIDVPQPENEPIPADSAELRRVFQSIERMKAKVEAVKGRKRSRTVL